MAKHAVPKQKKSKSRTRKRYGSFKTKVLKDLTSRVNLTVCPDCGSKALMHTVCPECGKYKGRQVVDKQREIDKITKIKA